MSLRSPVLTFAVASSLALAACGSDDKERSGSTAAESSPATARAEIDKTSAGLSQALRQLRAGDRKQAEETVSETYLQHFELVEGPLGKVDEELNEELEEGISQELRDQIRSGAGVGAVTRSVTRLQNELVQAKDKLGPTR